MRSQGILHFFPVTHTLGASHVYLCTAFLLADRTATQHDRRNPVDRLTVRPSVCDVLHSGSQGSCTWLMRLYQPDPIRLVPIFPLRHFLHGIVSFNHKTHRKNRVKENASVLFYKYDHACIAHYLGLLLSLIDVLDFGRHASINQSIIYLPRTHQSAMK